mmetsp:Transcript_64597/g.126838  ORF Transcript_64597/g.126838 Transcript_64597/m.126838 type:complete len:103 (+) Transcript_64597:197-505(+)
MKRRCKAKRGQRLGYEEKYDDFEAKIRSLLKRGDADDNVQKIQIFKEGGVKRRGQRFGERRKNDDFEAKIRSLVSTRGDADEGRLVEFVENKVQLIRSVQLV